MIKPPFNNEIIKSFNKYQESGIFHPYTCGEDSCSGILEVKTEYMYCPNCDYKQYQMSILPNDEDLNKQKSILESFLIKSKK